MVCVYKEDALKGQFFCAKCYTKGYGVVGVFREFNSAIEA